MRDLWLFIVRMMLIAPFYSKLFKYITIQCVYVYCLKKIINRKRKKLFKRNMEYDSGLLNTAISFYT